MAKLTGRHHPVCRMPAAGLACILAVAVILGGCGGAAAIHRLTSDSLVLAFGDSLTSGKGAPAEQAYPTILSELLGCRIINAGQPGELSADGLKRLPALLETHRPDLVILCHGGNDLLQKQPLRAIEHNLSTMIDMIKASGADVVLVAVPQPGIFLSRTPFYEDLAREHGIPCEADIIASILSSPELKSDYVHPNPQGYRIFAEALAQLIGNSQAS